MRVRVASTLMRARALDECPGEMHGHSRILLDEATRLMTTTRRRIDLTLALLGKPSPSAARAQTPVPPSGVQPLEQRKDQLRPVGLELGVDAELQARR